MTDKSKGLKLLYVTPERVVKSKTLMSRYDTVDSYCWFPNDGKIETAARDRKHACARLLFGQVPPGIWTCFCDVCAPRVPSSLLMRTLLTTCSQAGEGFKGGTRE